ncbi:GH92 family glycosyl hydrolase [Bacillus sp. SD088]|uniref:GH92 family glycosyl hydrolase n=1 Tax=Bacillus sp. SD088 TaxID=2782012 RepID=UPI001A960D8A|nr:GH92 family glycosyl hydrolase [Bacillus sp. SD088]MBO0995788.1 GH92 family glycosyl hydrolase [Bacillus sp. SD088]
MSLIDYVNIRMGTKSNRRYSNGNTVPFTQRPWAMAGFSPQTSSEQEGWFYDPDDRGIEGVRLTHQPSPWIRDYGNIVIMPQSGKPFINVEERWSGYKPEASILQPDYMNIDFLRYQTRLELTPTTRGACIRLNFHSQAQPRLGLFPVKDGFTCEIDPQTGLIKGYTTAMNFSPAENYAMYYVMQVDCGINLDDSINGEDGASIALDCQDEVTVRMAISFISMEQAILNLEQELKGKSFNQVRLEAQTEWEELLGKIEIETDDQEQLNTFYSCMYRICLFPHRFHEYDQDQQPFHYCPHDGKVRAGVLYTDSGFWDTYRSVYPLYALIFPDQYQEMVQGYVNFYKDSGWLPKWPCPGDVGAMPGTLIDGVIADAAVKGIISGDLLQDAFAGMLKHAEQEVKNSPHGRHGTADYLKYGYIPRDKYHESVNHTLDYAYGDFCIAQVAKLLGEEEVAARYYQSAKNYKNLFDPESGFMRGKDTEGKMAAEFNPYAWGGEYCEGGPWQNSFGVFHDIDGLIALYGGEKQFEEKLDELFHSPPLYDVGAYNHEIHEMTEMTNADFGQCAISNQPSFHLPWLYAMTGVQDKTDHWVAKIAKEGFSSGVDGYPGDEDNGSLSAWYILATIGLYSVCPGKTEYIRNKPLVDKAILHTQEGDLVIDHNSMEGSSISYHDLMNSRKR